MIVIGITGFDGGKLKEMSDVSLVVKTEKGEYGPVESIHGLLNHLITSYIYLHFQKASNNSANNVVAPEKLK